MFAYLTMPFSAHYGNAFKDAGDSLKPALEARLRNQHLPVGFLYRHAIELYLKSILVVMSWRFDSVAREAQAIAACAST